MVRHHVQRDAVLVPWTVVSGRNYDYAIFTTTSPNAEVTIGVFTMTADPALATPPATPATPWRLALNIDTDDGNALHFDNAAFWEVWRHV